MEMEMELVNLTPHPVTFLREGREPLTVPPSGRVARAFSYTEDAGEDVCGVPVTRTRFSEVTGLPDPKEGTAYVVSAIVAQRARGRKDVFLPNETVRDADGRVIGCRSLGRA